MPSRCRSSGTASGLPGDSVSDMYNICAVLLWGLRIGITIVILGLYWGDPIYGSCHVTFTPPQFPFGFLFSLADSSVKHP